MAVGPPSGKVEIEWKSGTWTDVTSYVAIDHGMSGTFGRASEFDDISAGTWQVVLRNDDGRFTPNNPLSPYYPNVVENVRLRVTVTPPGGSSYVRFLGFVTNIDPSFPDEDGFTGIVTIGAADLLAVMNRRTMGTGYVEQANFVARLNKSWNDTWTFNNTTATVYENEGEKGARTSTAKAAIKVANSGAGQAAAGSVDGLMVDGALTLSPTGIVGPVLEVDLVGTPQQIDFFVKIPNTGLAYNATASARNSLCIADFYTSSGELFSLRLENSGNTITTSNPTSVDLSLHDGSGNFLYFLHVAGMTGDQSVDTDSWLKITLVNVGGTAAFATQDSGILSGAVGFDMTTITKVFFGGYVPGGKAGKQTYCPAMSLAGFNIEGVAHGAWYYFALGTPPTAAGGTLQRYQELCGYGSAVIGSKLLNDVTTTAGSAVISSASANFNADDVGKGVFVGHDAQLITPYFAYATTITSVQSPTQATLSATASTSNTNSYGIIGPAIIGTDGRDIVRYNPSGQTLAEALQLHARTIGGAMWVSNTGVPTLILADAMRSTTAIATVDIEADADASDLELRRSVDQAPTRVTVTSPLGQQIVVDAVAETAGYRRELSVASASVSDTDLKALGSYYLAATKALRITKLTVDLAQSQNNLYAAFLGSLRPGSRVRISGLPSATFGFSYVDIFIQGWTEKYDHESAMITFDCSPCDAPVEGAFDDTEYGRFAADGTLTLASPITVGATSLGVVPAAGASTGSPIMTTASADYPLDIDLNGERITLPATPTTTSRTNLCTNPSFEVALTSWTTTLASYTTGSMATILVSSLYPFAPVSGSRVMQVGWATTAAGGSCLVYQATGLTIGQVYTFSMSVYVPSGAGRLKVADASNTVTGISYPTRTDGTSMQTTGTTVNAWTRLAMTFTATATSHNIGVVNLDAWTNGWIFYADAALLELASSVGSYFDGSYAGGTWTGTANASTSTATSQVFAGVTRGVAPTVARAHLGGEDVDLWHAAAAAL